MTDVLDLAEFLERVQDDKELLVELLDIYLGDFDGKRKALIDAVENKDFEQIKSVSHSLKGASGNISAKNLREIFIQFEEMAKAEDLSQAQTVVDNMDKQFGELTEHISSLKEEYQG